MFTATEGEYSSPILIDTLVDMAVYAIKWLAIICEIRPEDFRTWATTVYATTMDIPQVEALKMFDMLVTEKGVIEYARFGLHQQEIDEDKGELPRSESELKSSYSNDAYSAYADILGKDIHQLTVEERELAIKLALSGLPRYEDREEL